MGIGTKDADTMDADPQPSSDTVDPDAVKTITDLAQKAYADENDRYKSIDGKTSTLIGTTGAGLLFLVGSVAKPPDFTSFTYPHLLEFYFGMIGVALTPILVAQLFFFWSIQTREAERFALEKWVTWAYLSMPVKELLPTLAKTYSDLIKDNTAVGNEKIKWQKRGMLSLVIGLTILGLGMIVMMFLLVTSRKS